MSYLKSAAMSAAFILATGTAVSAAGDAAAHQNVHGGKASSGFVDEVDNSLANCPFELRAIYRGTLYCRQPFFAVNAPRHPTCPTEVAGLYRGALYCFSGRN